MRIDSAGNVGIGTSSPSFKLDVTGTGRFTGLTQFDNAINLKTATLNYVYFDDALAFSRNGVGERMRIDSSGNLGIGTSSPVGKLNVIGGLGLGVALTGDQAVTPPSGSLVLSGTNLATEQTYTSPGASTTLGQIYNYASIANSYYRYLDIVSYGSTTGAGSNIRFITGNGTTNTERARIDSSGNLMVGVTSNSGQRLRVSGSSTNDNAGIFSAENTNTAAAACVAAFSTGTNSTATTNVLVRFAIDNYNQGSGQINANGAGAVAFGAFSDSRLKENIVDLPSQLDNIMSLRPVEFDYIKSMGGGHQIGFVAQEVQAIYPDLVGEAEDGMLTLTDMNKNDARLIKAIQEMKAISDSQACTITH
jgi:hypothetical protein